MYILITGLPELLLNSSYAVASASDAAGCMAMEAVLNLANGSCPVFCLSPDTSSGDVWWKVDLAALYWISHIELLGSDLQNLTDDLYIYSSTNDHDKLGDQSYKVSL